MECVDRFALRDYSTGMKLAFVFLSLVVTTFAADWLHYRGPEQNGTSTEKVAGFAKGELWRVQLGTGLSGITSAGARVFSAGYKDGKETLYCLDAATGKAFWTYAWTAKIGDNLFEGGPRATPTLDGDRVFMLGNEGTLFCSDVADGKVVWEKHLVRDFGGKRPEWGYCGSPTIDGANVLLDCGGTGVSTLALNKQTGALVWKSGDDGAGYASPIVANIGTQRTVVLFKAKAAIGLNAKSGRELWRHPFETSYDVNAASPLVVGDKVLISAGYNHGSAFLRVGTSAERLWFSKNLRSHFNSPVLIGGHVYGIDGTADPKAPLACIDFASGEFKWKTKEVQGGSLIVAGDKLLIFTETGDLVLADPSPTGYKELARQHLLSGRCWVQPTLSNGRIFCRNTAGELVAVAVAGK